MFKFKYRGLKWTVGFDQSGSLEERGFYGETYASSLRVELNTNMPRARLSLTLLHELMHVVDTMEDTEIAEGQIRILANGLFDLLRNNPKLRQYILEDVD